jgi:outer membrane lipoprotein-sorting protein
VRLAILAVLAIPAVAHAAASADDVLARVQGYYKNVAHLRGGFRQETTRATFGDTAKSHGTVELARPGKLRLDYAKPVGQGVKSSMRSDGTHFWVVNHDNLEIDLKDSRTRRCPRRSACSPAPIRSRASPRP